MVQVIKQLSYYAVIYKFGFTLLPCLVIAGSKISYKIKLEIHLKSRDAPKSRAPFLTANCRIFLIAGSIFSTAFYTMAAYMPLLRRTIHKENV